MLAVVFVLFALTVATVPASAQAQGLGVLTSGGSSSGSDSAQSDLAAAIRQAAESGVSVVVVDANGTIVGTAADTQGADSAGKTDKTSGSSSPMMEGASTVMQVQSQIKAFRARLDERLQALPHSIREVEFILRATSPDGRIMTYVEAVFFSLLLFFGAYFVTREIYGKRIAARFVVPRVHENPVGYREKMPFLVIRFFAGIGGTLFTMVVAGVTGYLIFGETNDVSVEFTITAVYLGFFITRTVADLWRMILSPYMSQHRIPSFSDQDARRLFNWMRILATLDVSIYMAASWLQDFGLNYNLYAITYGVLALVSLVGNILMFVFNGRSISNAIRDGRPPEQVSWSLRFASFAWAPLLIAYMVFGWLSLSFDLVLENPVGLPMLAGLYMVMLAVIVVYGVINFCIESYFARSRLLAELNRAQDEAEGRGTETTVIDDLGEVQIETSPRTKPRRTSIVTYEQLARRVSAVLAFVAGSVALLTIWDTEGVVLAEGGMVDRLLDVVVILFIGYILYHLFRIWIDTRIAEENSGQEDSELGDEGGPGGASRLATLLPLFRGAILAVVVVAIGLIALLELGINVSPLFAGAGVVGLAVGFGAQTLVRDIFSGAFFLIDDAFRKGEYIDIGDVKGTVEKISVRSFQLRHHLGALNTIPFGEIRVLTNYSRDWVIMKLPLRVTYDTDVEKVRKLIKKLGQELLKDPVIGDNFIQPLKSQGVIEMQDSAMIIRVKFMTKPGDQWLVRKKVYQDIRELFAREGIKFAHREVTVRLAEEGAKDLTPKQREAVTGAVQAAIDEDYLDDIGPGGDDR